MKKFWKMPLYVAFGALMATGLTACSDNENNDGTQTGTLSETLCEQHGHCHLQKSGRCYH